MFARAAIQLAQAGEVPYLRNVTHYLLGRGIVALESKLNVRPSLGTRSLRLLRSRATPVYLGSIALLTVSLGRE